MFAELEFEQVAMLRPDGPRRVTIPNAERRAAMEPALTQLIAGIEVRRPHPRWHRSRTQ